MLGSSFEAASTTGCSRYCSCGCSRMGPTSLKGLLILGLACASSTATIFPTLLKAEARSESDQMIVIPAL